MVFFFLAFLAGGLTVLAPCVLPVLPVILGGSVQDRDPRRPFIITASLGLSVILFTLVLKVSTIFITVPQIFWQILSGGILFFFGIITIFPTLWEKISTVLKFNSSSQKLLQGANQKKGVWGIIFLGASLGPVFASCSPVYFIILATVLPHSFFMGFLDLLAYGFGLSIVLFCIAFFGQKIIFHLRFAANPRGLFRKFLGALFLFIGLAILMGWDKTWELNLGNILPFDETKIETPLTEKFLPHLNQSPAPQIQNTLSSSTGTTMTTPSLSQNKPMTQNISSSSAPTPPSTPSETPATFDFQKKYPAPELAGLTNWINSSGYNSLHDLKGKVVLVDFWTYSCINCIRTLPYIEALHEKYKDDGLVVLGIHTPEFAFEHNADNVRNAVKQFHLTYPVVQDNDFQTWNNFNNHYWPAKYLIDRDGYVRYTHFGEGEYETTEQAIAALLHVPQKNLNVLETPPDFSQIQTPETYLGLSRRENKVSSDTKVLGRNKWKITGNWTEDNESISPQKFPASLFFDFTANKANLVMGGQGKANLFIDGKFIQTIEINEEKLSPVADFQNQYGHHVIEVQFTEGANIKLYAWTFG